MTKNGSNHSGIKRSWVGMVLILCMVVLSACGQAADNKAADTKAADNGKKTVSADSRIASMSIHLTNNLLALGITPAGSVIGGDVKDFLPHVKDRLQNTRKLGVVTDPDMEAVLELQPDHIFLDKKYSGADVAKYEKIAPTEVFDLDEGTWKDQLKKIAVMVKHEAQADAFLKDYDAQQERVKKADPPKNRRRNRYGYSCYGEGSPRNGYEAPGRTAVVSGFGLEASQGCGKDQQGISGRIPGGFAGL